MRFPMLCLGALLLAGAAPAAAPPAAPDLVVNGGLEDGRGGSAKGWSGLDGLVVRRVRRADGRGHCLQMDTGTLRSERKAHQESLGTFRRSAGRRDQYATVGAHEGAWAFAAPVDLEPGWRYYVLSVAARCVGGAGEPMVLVRGYRRVAAAEAGRNSSWFHRHHPGGPCYSEQFGPDGLRRPSRAGDYLMVYRHTLHCRPARPGEWERFELGIRLPSLKSAVPERLLLKPFACWPVAVYQFDDLALRRATRQEVERLRARR